MMYYVNIITRTPRYRVEEAIIAECERWNGTLLTDEQARISFIDRMCDFVSSTNTDFARWLRCSVESSESGLFISSDDDGCTFAEIYIDMVKLVYDGYIAKREKEGGSK